MCLIVFLFVPEEYYKMIDQLTQGFLSVLTVSTDP